MHHRGELEAALSAIATNNFYGPQIGVRGRFDWGRFFLSGALKFRIAGEEITVREGEVLGTRHTDEGTMLHVRVSEALAAELAAHRLNDHG